MLRLFVKFVIILFMLMYSTINRMVEYIAIIFALFIYNIKESC